MQTPVTKIHRGRIAYPKYYWRIMRCRSINSDAKKRALKFIRDLYNNPEGFPDVDIFDSSDDPQIRSAFRWITTPQGYDFWYSIAVAINEYKFKSTTLNNGR